MKSQVPPAAVLVSHRVSDWESWKRVFDDHTQERIEASCLGHHVNRGADDPNKVHIYCPCSDTNKMKAFMQGPELPEIMKKAGVTGPPTAYFMKPMSADFIPDQKLAGIIVTHEVEDYDRWRAAYDDFDDHRKQVGIVGHAVNQEMGKPNHVIIYHQAKDVDTLRKFVDSAELREAMQAAGVVGAPKIEFVQSADYAAYVEESVSG